MMGIFSEYIRSKKNSFRSSHPLLSFSGIGSEVRNILGKRLIPHMVMDRCLKIY